MSPDIQAADLTWKDRAIAAERVIRDASERMNAMEVEIERLRPVVAAAVAWRLDPQRRALSRTLERAVDAYEAASGEKS